MSTALVSGHSAQIWWPVLGLTLARGLLSPREQLPLAAPQHPGLGLISSRPFPSLISWANGPYSVKSVNPHNTVSWYFGLVFSLALH